MPPQHGILFQQFQALINQCNASQSAYRDRNVERIQRQLQISAWGVGAWMWGVCGGRRLGAGGGGAGQAPGCGGYVGTGAWVQGDGVGAWVRGVCGGQVPGISHPVSCAAGGGVVSDEELEQMLETGQTEVFVSNVSVRGAGLWSGGAGPWQALIPPPAPRS